MGKNSYIRKTTGVYNPVWTPAEEAVITAHYFDSPAEVLCAALPGRCWKSICVHASSMGVARQVWGAWSKNELALMRAHYVTTGPTRMTDLLPGRTLRAIACMGKKMGLQTDRLARPTKQRRRSEPATPKVAAPKPPKPQREIKPVMRAARFDAKPKRVLTPTPNLAAQKALVAKKKAVQVSVTAEEIRKLAPNDPQRRIYAIGGRAAVEAYRSTLQAA